MSGPERWSVDLADSATMVPIIGLGEATSRNFKPAFNKPGTFDIQLPIDAQASYLIRPRATCLIASRAGAPLWSGGCTSLAHDGESGTTRASFTGWMEEADYRFVRVTEEAALASLGATDTIGGQIVSTLVTSMNAQTDSGAVVRPTHIGAVERILDTQTRRRTYKRGDNYGQIIRELVEIENGCDITMDPMTRRITTRPPTAFTDRTNVHFGFSTFPNNLDGCGITYDGTTIFNRETVVSANGTIYVADDATAIASSGVMLEEWASLADVNDPTIVLAYANAELVYKRYGTITYQVRPRAFGNVPRLFSDYQLGDMVYFSADRGAMRISKQAVRVFSASIEIDPNGNEVIGELVLAP